MSELKSMAIDKLLERHSYCAEKAIESIEGMIEERLATIEDLNNEIENLRVDKDRLSIVFNYSQVLAESIEPMADHLIKETVKDNVSQPVDYYGALDRFNNFSESVAATSKPYDEILRYDSYTSVPFSDDFVKVSYYEAFKGSSEPNLVFLKNISNTNIIMLVDVPDVEPSYVTIPISDQLIELTSIVDYYKWGYCSDLLKFYNKAPSIIELYIESDQDSSEPVNEPDKIDEILVNPDEDMGDFAELDHNVVVYTDQDLINSAHVAAETWGWGFDLLEDPTKIPKFSPFSLACFHTTLMDDLQADVDRNELEEFIIDSPYFEEYTPGMWRLSQDNIRYSYDNIIKSAQIAIEDSKNNVLKLTDAEDNVFGLWAFITAVFNGVTSVELSDIKEAKQKLLEHPRITMVTETHYRLEEEDGI